MPRLSGIFALGFALTAIGFAETPPTCRVSDLAWLAGHWRGTLASGATFDAHYTDTTGGTVVGASKEVRGGRTVGVELELFYERDGSVIYQPFPNGVKSERHFPLREHDVAANRVVFENQEHDFPQTFSFQRRDAATLVITLQGPGKNGALREITYTLARVVATP
ncbi:MAG: DUF6265 family protein [Candidatus Didemnitutus sp.]|nr:DUF6265 family protein [Candidatus Didemnitutus sp.]